jgi:hypothetical protein
MGHGVGRMHFRLHSPLFVYVPVAEKGPLDGLVRRGLAGGNT